MPKGMRMIDRKIQLVVCFLMLGFAVSISAGPYTEGGVNGYVGSDFKHANPLSDLDAVLHPIFRGWATGVDQYQPSDTEWTSDWDDPNRALGPASGDHFDTVSLGDMDASEISAGDEPGQITLVFGDPYKPNDPNHIRDVNGYDFAVFENGFLSETLLQKGYNTYAIGKWHLTPADQISAAGPYERWPLGRGFERYYGFLGGETHQYFPELIYDNHQVEPPTTPEEGYHVTEDLVDKAISFIADAKLKRQLHDAFVLPRGHDPD